MKYNFDREIHRQGTSSVKWEFIQSEEDVSLKIHTNQFFGKNRKLPMWVADMDFAVPQPIIDALTARAAHGIFGYTAATEPYFDALVNWMKRRHGWVIKPEWTCLTPGVVSAVSMLAQTFVSPGDKILLQTPAYYPFYFAIENNEIVIVRNSLINKNNYYTMDFVDLDEKTKDPKVKMAILCNPHNPVGRVWTKEELIQFGEICFKNNVLVISDEIHGDLIMKGSTFTPFASISNDFLYKSITCTAPSKTFNLAGLQTSNIIIPDENLRSKYTKTIKRNGVSHINTFGIVALEAAYNHGEEWLEQVLDYIEGNFNYLKEYIDQNIPEIIVLPLEGTYLTWLDCRKLGLGNMALKKLMIEDAGVYLDEGFIFGSEGDGFERINIACPRSILVDALERIKNVIHKL